MGSSFSWISVALFGTSILSVASGAVGKDEFTPKPRDIIKGGLDIVILPEANNVANIIAKRIGDTLNLTCIIKLRKQDEKDLYFRHGAAEDMFDLSWSLPGLPRAEHSVILKSNPQLAQLLVKNVEERDTGEYKCHARLISDTRNAFSSSVRVVVKPKIGSCEPPSYLCTSGECIPKRFVCDGRADCKDGSDEEIAQCGRHPCDGKLTCEDGRCMSPHWCCNHTKENNCSVGYVPACCQQLDFVLDLRWLQYPIHPQQYNENLTYLQTTIYTVIGCAMAFMFIITIMVVAICRVHLKRTAMNRYLYNRNNRYASWTSVFFQNPPGSSNNSNFRCNSGSNGLMVAYNINNGVQFVNRPPNPPPYSEVVQLPLEDGPPPPYTSVEDVRTANTTSIGTGDSQQRRNRLQIPEPQAHVQLGGTVAAEASHSAEPLLRSTDPVANHT